MRWRLFVELGMLQKLCLPVSLQTFALVFWIYFIVLFQGEQVNGCEEVDVTVEEPNAFHGRPYFIRCSLRFIERNFTRLRHMTMKMEHMKRKKVCPVRHWSVANGCLGKANPEVVADDNCKCTHNWGGINYYFRFFYFIKKVDYHWDNNANFTCSVTIRGKTCIHSETIKVFTQLDNHNKIHVCPGKRLKLSWQTNTRGASSKAQFPFRKAQAKYNEHPLATITPQTHGEIKIEVERKDFKNRIYFSKKGTHITLEINQMGKTESGEFKVKLIYDSKAYKVPAPKIPLTENNLIELTTSTGNPPWTRATTTTTTAATDTLPMATEKQPDMYIDLHTEVVVTQPPSRGATVQLKYMLTNENIGIQLLHAVVFICKVINMTNAGKPPIEISIYHGEQLLISRADITVIRYRYMISNYNMTSSCRFDGPSLDCLPTSDSRRKSSYVQVKRSSDNNSTEVPGNIILYSLSVVIVMVLLWWTIWLFITHIQLYVTRKKKLELYRAKVILLHRDKEMDM